MTLPEALRFLIREIRPSFRPPCLLYTPPSAWSFTERPECCKWCCFSFILIASAENSLQINPLSLCFKGTVSKYKLGVSNPGLVFDVFVEFERLFSLDDVLLALRFFYLWSSKSSLLVLCPLVVSYALFKRSRDGVVGFGCRVLMKLLWLRKCHDSR